MASVSIINNDGYIAITGLLKPVNIFKNTISEITTKSTKSNGVQDAILINRVRSSFGTGTGLFTLKLEDVTLPVVATIEDLMETVSAYAGSNSSFMDGYAVKAPMTVTLVPEENVIPHGLPSVPFLAWVEDTLGNKVVFSSLTVDATNVTIYNDSLDTYTNYILKILY